MKLLTCLVTHNRKELTKITLDTYLATVNCEYFLVVVDNASTDGTQKLLKQYPQIKMLILNKENQFPGKATNTGFRQALKVFSPDILHRSDNDLEYRSGWLDEVKKAFNAFPRLGQLGILNMEQEFYPEPNQIIEDTSKGYTLNAKWSNIGGPMVIRKQVYDEGVRYSDRPWHSNGKITIQEDVKYSLEVVKKGWLIRNLIPNLVYHLGDKQFMNKYPEYYRETFKLRGYDFNAWMKGEIKNYEG